MKRLSLVLLVIPFLFAGAQPPGKTKDVIPHAQSKPPGPPKSPAEALKAFTVPPGFSVELVAAEPDLVNPVAMHIDEKGRFWVTESIEYPKKQAGPGKDRVKVIEIGEDGKAKKITTVIEGLNIPSGIAVGHGGVWLANSPDILYYPIEDFDALKLGKPQVVVTGFGRADTHELPNSLTWGPDGWLYGLNGVFNPSHIKQGDKEWKFTCALFRIHPRTKQFEIFCEGTSNPWGLAFNDNGDAFVSACVIDHLWHLTQTGYYLRQGGAYPPFVSKIGSIVKHKHQKAAYCGLCWYDADAYPEEYRKKLYMGNVHGNCINADELTKDGSTYLAKPRPDFLSANDAWFMPVSQKVGPDGCMYVLDWYDRYHCYQDANRDPKGIDRLYGRLYRVRYKDTPRALNFDLTAASDQKLLENLNSPNVFVCETSQRILVERTRRSQDNGERLLGIAKLMQDESADKSARLRAFWTLIGADFQPRVAINRFAKSEDAVFRTWAVRALTQYRHAEAMAPTLLALSNDTSKDVLLQVAIAATKLREVDPFPVFIDVLNSCGDDKLIPHIVWNNLHPLLEDRSGDFLKLVAKLDLDKSPNVAAMMPKLVDRILASKNVDAAGLATLVAAVGKSAKNHDSAAAMVRLLNAKVQTGELAGDKLQALDDRLLPAVKAMQESKHAGLALEARLLGAALKDEESVQAVRELLTDASNPEATRLKAMEALIAARDNVVMQRVREEFARVKRSTIPFRGNVLAALGKLDDPDIARFVLERYGELEPELQARAIELLTQRPAWSLQLLEHVKEQKVPAKAVHVNQVRKMLATKNDDVKQLVDEIWGSIREGRNPEREKVVAEMRELLKKTPGDPQKGLAVYKKVCAQCHKLHGDGFDIGPDLTSNGRADFEQLLSNVFDPSLVIGLGYRQTNVVTKRGQVISGLLVEDSKQRIVLKTQGGKVETIARGDVEETTTTPLSYMPEAMERQLTPQEIADLFAVLVLDKHPSDPAARKIPGTPR